MPATHAETNAFNGPIGGPGAARKSGVREGEPFSCAATRAGRVNVPFHSCHTAARIYRAVSAAGENRNFPKWFCGERDASRPS